MNDDILDEVIKSGNYSIGISFTIEVLRLQYGKWRATIDLAQAGEQGLNGMLYALGQTRDEAISKVEDECTKAMVQWVKGPFGQPCVLCFRPFS